MGELKKAQAVPAIGTYRGDIAPFTQAQLNEFGDLVGTYGRIHTDPEWAATTPLKGVIVQGMLILAPLHDALVRMFGDRWTAGGEVTCKIVSSARPGDALRLQVDVGESREASASGTFRIEKTDGAAVVVGEFTVGSAAA